MHKTIRLLLALALLIATLLPTAQPAAAQRAAELRSRRLAQAQEMPADDVAAQDSVWEVMLRDVVVAAERPHYVVTGGRLMVDLPAVVKGRAVSNVYEALAHLPGVATDATTGSLTLTGASTMTILINGKRPQMSDESLRALLQSYSVERMQGVEVMYSAPAKYHVSGAAINIVLKTLLAEGLRGQVSEELTQRHYGAAKTSVAATYALHQWALEGAYSYTAGRTWEHDDINSLHTYALDGVATTESITQEVRSRGRYGKHHGRLAADWRLPNREKLSLAYNCQLADIGSMRNTTTGTQGKTIANTYSYPRKDFHSLTADYDSRFGLTAGMALSNYVDESSVRLTDMDTDGTNSTVTQDYSVRQRVNRLRLYADYSKAVGQWVVDGGMTYETSADHSSQTYALGTASNYAQRLTEHTADIYGGVERQLAQGLTMVASLRADYYHRGTTTRWWLAPQLALTLAQRPEHVVQLNISSHKNYPSYWQMQGAAQWLNSYTIVQGNPTLRPSYTYDNQLVYVHRQRYTAVLYYNYTDAPFMQSPYQAADAKTLIYRTVNFTCNQQLGLQLQAPLKTVAGLQTTLTLNAGYKHAHTGNVQSLYAAYGDVTESGTSESSGVSSGDGASEASASEASGTSASVLASSATSSSASSATSSTAFDFRQFAVYAKLDNSYRLPYKEPIYLTGALSYLSGASQGVLKVGTLWELDLGAKWTTMKGRADITLKVIDLFNTWSPKTTSVLSGQHLTMRVYDMQRYASLSFVYRFNGFNAKPNNLDTSRFGTGK